MATAAFALIAAVAVAIVVIPAELLFRANAGQWYRSERAANAAPRASSDFALYRAEFPIARKPQQLRILVVGGSTTYGFGVRAADAWPARLRNKLEKRHPRKFEVVDVSYLGGHLAGFVSDYTHASRRYISRELWLKGDRPQPNDLAGWGWRDLDPDIVIVAPVVNDTAPDFAFMRQEAGAPAWRRSVERALAETPLLADLAISYYARTVLRNIGGRAEEFDAHAARARIRESYRASLEQFVSLWGTGRQVLVVGLPWLFNPGDGPETVDLAMKAWGVRDRTELLDELSYFPVLERLELDVRSGVVAGFARQAVAGGEIGRGLKASSFPVRLRWYLDALHVNAEGHEAFAEEIYGLISRASLTAR